jgi:ethanolamine-phosphate phospho-lyase
MLPACILADPASLPPPTQPFGNGFPLAAVVTTPAVSESFRTSEYFNTFGGSTLACAVGLEVLKVIEEDGLQANARTVGASVLEQLRGVASRHPRIGDVRGRGLLVGVEFVQEGGQRVPDAELAAFVMRHMRAAGVLVSTDGPHRNVIKIKPPLCFSEEDAHTLAEAMESALRSAPK